MQFILIFFYIYIQSTIIKITYSIQEAEYLFQDLQKKKKSVMHELLQAQEPEALQEYAINELHMKKMRITDLQELPELHDK